MVGRFVDERRALESDVRRHYDLSLDMFCTARFDGYFERLNPAWEKVLGHTAEELRSRPFIEFVHPDDRERTRAETARLRQLGADTISFRNRYRCAGGDYRWLEWRCHADAGERRIYATARDVTVQQRAEVTLQTQSQNLELTVRERTQALGRLVSRRFSDWPSRPSIATTTPTSTPNASGARRRQSHAGSGYPTTTWR